MSIADLGSLGEFVASFGVLITLIFLTFQMRQNTKAVRASMASQMTSQWLGNSNTAASNPDLVAVMMTISPEDVSPPTPTAEGVRFSFWVSSALKAAEFAHFQWQEGNLDPRLWETNVGGLMGFLTIPAFSVIWSQQKAWYTPEFQQYVDDLISKAV